VGGGLQFLKELAVLFGERALSFHLRQKIEGAPIIFFGRLQVRFAFYSMERAEMVAGGTGVGVVDVYNVD
jgi:hypothetical protein